MSGAGMMDCKHALEEANNDFEKAMEIITEGAGKHFDPVVVKAFTQISKRLYDERTRLEKEA